jgi:phosphoglycerate dehydrogenase-like enzyme
MKVLIGANPMGLEKTLPPCGEGLADVTFVHEPERGNLAAAIADADVYVGWIGDEQFAAAEQLKWIQSPSSGTNYYLAIPALVESDVLLTSARGTHAACVADSAMAMILSFTRGVRDSVIAQQNHDWGAAKAIRPKLLELTGSTMGIVGIGAIGQAIAKRAKAFGMRVDSVDAFVTDGGEYVDSVLPLDRLGDLMATSDYVVVTLPWTPETDGMINAEMIGKMKSTGMLVGMSRGGIIDQDALGVALREQRINCAALDVFKPEPLARESDLWDLENLLILPHITGGTQLEGQYIADIFRENLGKFLNNDLPLRNQVDKVRGF